MPIACLSRNGRTPSARISALAELRYRADSDLCLFRLLPGLCLLLSRRRREAVTIPTVAMGAVIVYLQLELEPELEPEPETEAEVEAEVESEAEAEPEPESEAEALSDSLSGS